MTIEAINKLSTEALYEALERCCGAKYWVNQMLTKAPYASKSELLYFADYFWENAHEECWLEAFTHHPKIGDISSLEKKFANTKQWAEGEQSGVQSASREVLEALAEGNQAYEKKFGYIFIVCATGKTASEMLALLNQRLPNEEEAELLIAMKEQQKITKIRLEKLLNNNKRDMSQITTHVLDTSIGKPGEGIHIQLQEQQGDDWKTIAEGVTNEDGRIADLLDKDTTLPPALYRMIFHTDDYFSKQEQKAFYPIVIIHFQTIDESHYHIPLLLNPFGYSTYRGS